MTIDDLCFPPDPTLTQAADLHGALLDSRQRWRAFVAIAADLTFEADADGRLTFVSPAAVLGHEAAKLLGHPLAVLLAEREAALSDAGPLPPMRQHPTWMCHADGGMRCMAMTVVPLLDAAGAAIGARGIGIDVTDRERRDTAASAVLRRAELLEHVLAAMRQEIMASRMMGAVLHELMRALGAEGAAILDLAPPEAPLDGLETEPDGGAGHVLHFAGADPHPLLTAATRLLQHAEDDVAVSGTSENRQILVCPASTRFGERAGLIAWRPAAARPWDSDDQSLAASVTGVIRVVLEHEAIQRELARQARTDPLTGLLNRRAFLEEAGRRIDRLDREVIPGTLIFLDLDRLKPLNDRLGHEAGDAALMLTADLLRRTFRPTDLVARLGGDEFALWMDGSDELTAAERAESLRTGLPAELAHLTAGEPCGMTLSIGIASRPGGSGEDLESLIQRADQAMYEVKRQGGGQWRVSRWDAAR
ncbi:MAG TPA: sensor domain-containing diguanylate cyclase [Acetobacteraceae bacterium]